MSLDWGLAGLAAICLAACWLDVTKRRLPNWLSVLALLTGLGLAGFSGGLSALGWHGLHAVVALVGGMALFAIGAIGGGDAKFYAGIASWFPFALGLRLFVAVAVAGALVLLAWIVWRKLKHLPILVRNREPGEGLPYGVAIAGGAILLALTPLPL